GPKWFQLYIQPDRAASREMVHRAESAGYGALCLTVDVPRFGRRERDLRNGFSLPRGGALQNLDKDRMPKVEQGATSAQRADSILDASLTWDVIAWLRSETKIPIVVKGIIAAEDAALAVQAGVDGIVVSNHGGRQLDGCEPTLEALP